MTLTFKVYPNRGLVLQGSEKQLLKLVEKGIISENEDGTCNFTQGFKLSALNDHEKLIEAFLKDQWLPLWPTSKVSAKGISDYFVSGNTQYCKRYLKEFLNTYKGQYNFDMIFAATAAYLHDKHRTNFSGCSKNFNFIRRELANWCDLLTTNEANSLVINAKQYIEHVRRTATRARAKLVSRDGFGLYDVLGNRSGGQSNPDNDSQQLGSGESGHIQRPTAIKFTTSATRINKSHKE